MISLSRWLARRWPETSVSAVAAILLASVTYSTFRAVEPQAVAVVSTNPSEPAEVAQTRVREFTRTNWNPRQVIPTAPEPRTVVAVAAMPRLVVHVAAEPRTVTHAAPLPRLARTPVAAMPRVVPTPSAPAPRTVTHVAAMPRLVTIPVAAMPRAVTIPVAAMPREIVSKDTGSLVRRVVETYGTLIVLTTHARDDKPKMLSELTGADLSRLILDYLNDPKREKGTNDEVVKKYGLDFSEKGFTYDSASKKLTFVTEKPITGAAAEAMKKELEPLLIEVLYQKKGATGLKNEKDVSGWWQSISVTGAPAMPTTPTMPMVPTMPMTTTDPMTTVTPGAAPAVACCPCPCPMPVQFQSVKPRHCGCLRKLLGRCGR